MIHLYCGDGKGKTTAAMGLIIRALGRGKKVVLAQFLKSWETGEVLLLKDMENITILRGKDCKKFSFQMNDEEKENLKKQHTQLLQEAINLECDLLVLDEAMGTYNCDLLDRKALCSLVENWDKEKELVMTGRDPDAYFVEKADYVSEIQCRKHPYTEGVKAREGIEF